MVFAMDNFFWPSAFQVLDFTLKFEETVLEIVPDGAFLVFGLLAYLHYRRQPAYIRKGPLLSLKVVSIPLSALSNICTRLIQPLSGR